MVLDHILKLTHDSAFMATVASELIHQDKIQFGACVDSEDFSNQVFQAYEDRNFEHVPHGDATRCRQLLCVVALLSPFFSDTKSFGKVAACLSLSAIEVERLYRQLESIELLVKTSKGARIYPDLFADFLVFDVCFGKKAKSITLVNALNKQPRSKLRGIEIQNNTNQSLRRKRRGIQPKEIEQMPEYHPSIIRNLAEAIWVARSRGMDVDVTRLTQNLFDKGLAAFKKSAFFDRTLILEHWQSFGVYLPEESIRLAEVAIEENEPGPQTSFEGSADPLINSYAYCLKHLTPLLQPITLYHETFREKALDLLWEMGIRLLSSYGLIGHNHSWEAIVDVIQFKPRQGIQVSIDVLDWLRLKWKDPASLQVLVEKESFLMMLLKPCFEQEVKYAYSEGMKICLKIAPISVENTQSIRLSALEIVQNLLDQGCWLSTFRTLSVLSLSISPLWEAKTSDAKADKKNSKLWNSHRLKGLQMLTTVLAN